MPGVRAIVPVKSYAFAKQRVRRLQPEHRRDLAQQLVATVVDALLRSGRLSELLLVGDGDARDLAWQVGGTWVEDPGLGLNAAVAAGLGRCDRFSERLVVMGDLPMLAPDDVRAAVAHGTPVTLFASRSRTGTNAVLYRAGFGMPPLFGGPSLAHHLTWAARNALAVEVVYETGFSLDVDTDADLLLARRRGFPFPRVDGLPGVAAGVDPI